MHHCRIDFVRKSPRHDPHKRIEEVGGFIDGHPTSIWRCSLDTAIQHALNNGFRFYTKVNGQYSEVRLHRGPSGLLHFRTEPDNTVIDNLLSLPNFPATGLWWFMDGPVGSQLPPYAGGLIPGPAGFIF